MAASSSNIQIPTSPGGRYQSLKSMLPVEVKILENYITWIEELANHVEKSAISKADSLENYIKLRLKTENSENDNRHEIDKGYQEDMAHHEEDKEYEVDPPGVSKTEESSRNIHIDNVAWVMNVAAMYTYLGDFASAKKHLDYLQAQNFEILNLPDKYKQIVECCRDSFAWAISRLIGLEEETERDANVKWKKLCEDGDDQAKATLTFLKAWLSLSMQVSEEITLGLYQEAIQLDPNCYIWYHNAYRTIRRIRRGAERNPGSKLPSPSEEEKRLARTAYNLSPEDVIAVTNYALLLKETLWMENKTFWKHEEKIYLECETLFREALDLAVKTKNREWSRKIKIYLAEFLCFGKGEKLDKDEGKRMFDECALDYPNSTFVLHKVAKLYHKGITGNHGGNKCIDLNRARRYYKQALDSNPENYACLMDYLKLLKKLNDYSEMIVSIDRALEHGNRDFKVAKLCVVKAFITWIHNPNQLPDPKSTALKLWLHVLENFPEYANNIYVSVNPIYFGQNHSAHGVHSEISKYSESVLKDRENSKEAMLIKDLMDGFTKSLNYPRSNLNRNYERRTQDNTNGVDGGDDMSVKMNGLSVSSRGNQQQRPFQGKREGNGEFEKAGKASWVPRRMSEADMDNNWRRKSEN